MIGENRLSRHFTYLPAYLSTEKVKACIGLIADTHVPTFCAALPSTLPEIFQGVQVILHAGDIGEQAVLDELGQIAPVVAVQGNDIYGEADRLLPLQQTLSASGQRILLMHSHHTDWAMERQARKEDSWDPKFARLVTEGRQVGAAIVVFGHTHIPMVVQQNGILLVNPGAIAPASALTRQTCRTVALLFILEDGSPVVVHVDVSAPETPYVPAFRVEKGFQSALNQVTSSLLDPDLREKWPEVDQYLRTWMGKPPYSAEFEALYAALLQLSHRCWSGEQPFISRRDLLNMIDDLFGRECISRQELHELRILLG